MSKKEENEEEYDLSDIKLSPEMIDDLKEAFSLFDKDGSGSISADELYLVLKSQGANPTKEEVRKLVDSIDLDGNGEIDLYEFL